MGEENVLACYHCGSFLYREFSIDTPLFGADDLVCWECAQKSVDAEWYCFHCHKFHPLSSFSATQFNKGANRNCKECVSLKIDSLMFEQQRDKKPKFIKCRSCLNLKEHRHYSSKQLRKGKSAICAKCTSKNNNNKDSIGNTYTNSTSRQKLERQKTALIRDEILEAANYTCHYCKAYGDTIDHKVPISKGGLSDLSNCVCCCSDCNQLKLDMPYTYFKKYLSRILAKHK